MYKSQNVTEVMQLNTVADATHGSMPCAAQTQAQLPPHHATAIATRSATFCHGHDRATPTPANRLRRRGVVLLFVCGGARLHAAPLQGRRRYRDAKMRAPARGGGQRSADEETCAVHDLVAGATTTRQRAQTGIAEGLKRVPAHRVDTPRQRVDIF